MLAIAAMVGTPAANGGVDVGTYTVHVICADVS